MPRSRLPATVAALAVLAGCGHAGPGAAPVAGGPSGPPTGGSWNVDRYATHPEEWRNSAFVRSLDPRTLEQVGSLGHAPVEHLTLADAVKHADLAVLGTVERVELGDPTLATFRVERVAKGDAPDTLTYLPNFWPESGDSWQDAFLEVREETPVLLAGDRAVLLLEKPTANERRANNSAAYVIQAWSGGWKSVGGRMHSVEIWESFDDAEGLTEDELMNRIEALTH